MRNKGVLSIVIIFSLCVVLAGCHRDRAASAPTMTPSPTMSPMPTPTPGQTPTPVPTPTPTPKPTPTPAPTSKLDPSFDYHPIIFTLYNDTYYSDGIIFAGSYAGGWVDIIDFVPEPEDIPYPEEYLDDFSVPLVRGGETYHMCSIRGNAGPVTGSSPDYYYFSSCGTDFLLVTYDPKIPEPEGASILVGVSGDWDPCPRIASPLDAGMGNRIDLDGDGVEEIIHFEPDPSDLNSIDYVLENQAGRTRSDSVAFDDTYTTCAETLFADLNGDGVMEVVQTTGGFCTSFGIYEYKNGALSCVISLYLGD